VSLALPGHFSSQHLQIIDFQAEFGFGDAVKKLPNARLCAGLQLGGSAVGYDAAFVEQDHAVGDQESAGEFMRHHNDGDAEGLFQFEQELVDSRRDDGIEAGGRFVKKKNFRIHGHGASDGGALFIPPLSCAGM